MFIRGRHLFEGGVYIRKYGTCAGFHTRFVYLVEGGGEVFSHASMKHVNVGGSGGIPPGKVFEI